MAFHAEQRSIGYLLSNNLYAIPRNQRKYVWGINNWEDLWSDLEFVANIHQHGKRHFLGSIVLRDEDKVSGVQRYTVIDGQQRIITIILFMSSLISVLKESGNMDDFEGTKTKLIIRDLKNKENCILQSDFHSCIDSIVLKVCSNDDKRNFKEILEESIVNKNDDKNIRLCCLYFYDKLSKLEFSQVLNMRDILLGTSYVEIVATTEEDSYTIFEILNARGQELEDHELVKNYVMRYIQPQEQSRVDRVKNEWELYIDRLLGTSVGRFFSHYSVHKYTEREKKSEVYKTIKKGTDREHVNEFFEDLKLKAKYYETIGNPVCEGERQNCSIEEYKIFHFLKRKKAVQFRPVILSLMHMNKLDKISDSDYIKALNFIYEFYICFNVIGEEKSNKIDEPINKYASLIEKDMTLSIVNQFMKSMIERLPPKEAFMLKFETIGFSKHVKFYQGSKNHDRAYLVLELIEQKLSGRTEIDDFTIEHVCADSQGEENAQIGNLIPLEDLLNHRGEDKTIEEKLTIYEDSNFATARKLVRRIMQANGSFNPKQRSKYLGEMLYNDIVNFLNEDNIVVEN